MTPQDTRVWRKDARKARRGVPTGRHVTRRVQTTPSKQELELERLERMGGMYALIAALVRGNAA